MKVKTNRHLIENVLQAALVIFSRTETLGPVPRYLGEKSGMCFDTDGYVTDTKYHSWLVQLPNKSVEVFIRRRRGGFWTMFAGENISYIHAPEFRTDTPVACVVDLLKLAKKESC